MNWRRWASILQILFACGVLAYIGAAYPRGDISDRYFNLYFMLGVLTILWGVLCFIVDFGKDSGRLSKSLLGQAFFWFEESPVRPLSWGYLPLVVFGLASIIVLGALAQNGAAFYDPVVAGNPYQAGAGLSQSSLSQHGFFSNIMLGAVVPAVFEEGITAFGIGATAGILVILFAVFVLRNPKAVGSPLLYWPMALISLALWSYLFAIAHGRYEGSQQILLFAFTFEFVVQGLNLLTGSFLSWIPHMLHNAAVVADLQFSSSLLAAIAAPAAQAIIFPAWLVKRSVKHE
jgi:hypothetical protein